MTIMTIKKRDKQKDIKGDFSKAYDHEFANEPLTDAEKLNNKKTKKRQ